MSTAPLAPHLLFPLEALCYDIAAGVTFSAIYNSTDSANQNAFALRVSVSGGSYGYWNGTDFSSASVVWNAVATPDTGMFFVSVPAGVLANGHVYNWSFASQESGANLKGVFATDSTFTSQAAPTVTVTAPTGSIALIEPTVTWSETLAPSASQTFYRVVVESGAYGVIPFSGTSVWDSGVVPSAALSAVVGGDLANGVTYRVFVVITETGGQASAWGYNTFTVT
jgi:hypothetical protein